MKPGTPISSQGVRPELRIRGERTEDAAAVRRVHCAAFGQAEAVEARIVDLLRERGLAVVSLVAEQDGEVVGHVLFSAVAVEAAEGLRALGLAPLAVIPELQNRGIGSQLTRAGLEACRAAGYDAVVVLGEPRYYNRFGFRRAADYGLRNEYGADAEFMALELRSGALQGASGLVRYAREFAEADS